MRGWGGGTRLRPAPLPTGAHAHPRRVRIDPNYQENEKGHIEILIETTGATESGERANTSRFGRASGASQPRPSSCAAQTPHRREPGGARLASTCSPPARRRRMAQPPDRDRDQPKEAGRRRRQRQAGPRGRGGLRLGSVVEHDAVGPRARRARALGHCRPWVATLPQPPKPSAPPTNTGTRRRLRRRGASCWRCGRCRATRAAALARSRGTATRSTSTRSRRACLGGAGPSRTRCTLSRGWRRRWQRRVRGRRGVAVEPRGLGRAVGGRGWGALAGPGERGQREGGRGFRRDHGQVSRHPRSPRARIPRRSGTPTAPGHTPAYPAVYETEFKRPTGLPAKLQCVCTDGTSPLAAAVLTSDGAKEVIVGKLSVA